MNVKLLNYTPKPEKTVAAAARLCYSDANAADILDGFTEEKVETFLSKLVSMGHYSPFEHINFTFAVEGVSRALTHQLVRHRIASYSQKSQRYVYEDYFDFIIPPSIAKNEEALEIFEKNMNYIREAYDQLSDLVPREDARYVLPNACESKIVCTFNARSLFNFFRLRCCSRAQWEIRELARCMLNEVKNVAPVIFKKAGPPCETENHCPEGDMSCGRIKNLHKS